MANLIKKKIQNRIGTSLVETLATVVLLGIMGVALTAGVAAVHNAYRKVVRKANEQVLLSTTIVEMRDIIRHSTDFKTKEGKQYFCTDKGYWVEFVSPKESNGIPVEQGISVKYYMYNMLNDTFTQKGDAIALVPSENGGISNIHSEFTGFSETGNGVYTIQGITVKGNDDNDGLVPIDYSVSRFHFKTNPGNGGGS